MGLPAKKKKKQGSSPAKRERSRAEDCDEECLLPAERRWRAAQAQLPQQGRPVDKPKQKREEEDDLARVEKSERRDFFRGTKAPNSAALLALKRNLAAFSSSSSSSHEAGGAAAFGAEKKRKSVDEFRVSKCTARGKSLTEAAFSLPVFTATGSWQARDEGELQNEIREFDAAAFLRQASKNNGKEEKKKKRQQLAARAEEASTRQAAEAGDAPHGDASRVRAARKDAEKAQDASSYSPPFKVSEDAWVAVRKCRSLEERKRQLAATSSAILAAPEVHIADFEVLFAFFFHAKKRCTQTALALESLAHEKARFARARRQQAAASCAPLKRRQAEAAVAALALKEAFLRSAFQEGAYIASASLLSLAAVVRDVLPAYRLGLGGAEEEEEDARKKPAFLTGKSALKTLRLSKEVEKLHSFESQLLQVYRHAERLLETEVSTALAAFGLSSPSGSAAARPEGARAALASSFASLDAATTALCELIRASPKFNESDRLMHAAVLLAAFAPGTRVLEARGAAEAAESAREREWSRARRTLQHCGLKACDCLRELIQDDSSLEVVLAVAEEISHSLDEAEKRRKKAWVGAQDAAGGAAQAKARIQAGDELAGLSAPLLDIFLSLRLREKEMEALRGDDRLPEKADQQLKQNLRLGFIHTEKKVFKKREASLLERLFIIYLKILKSMDRQPPPLVTSAFRGLVCFSSHINEELLSEILLLFQEMLLRPNATASQQLAARNASGDRAPGSKKGRTAKKNDDEEKEQLAACLQRSPEVGAAAVATPLLLLQRVNVILQMDVSWLATALCDLVQASLSQFASGSTPPSSAPGASFLPTSTLLQPFASTAASFPSLASSSLASLQPEFASRCLECLDLLLKCPQLWAAGQENRSASLRAAAEQRRATAKGHAAVLRPLDELDLFAAGERRAGFGRGVQRQSLDGALLALRELVRIAALGDIFIGDAVMKRVTQLLADTPRLQSAVDSEGVVLKGRSAALSLYYPLCLLSAHIHPRLRHSASTSLCFSADEDLSRALTKKEDSFFSARVPASAWAPPKASALAFSGDAEEDTTRRVCEEEEDRRRVQEARSRAFLEALEKGMKKPRQDALRNADARRDKHVCTAEDFGFFAQGKEDDFLDFLFAFTPAPSSLAGAGKRLRGEENKSAHVAPAAAALGACEADGEAKAKKKKTKDARLPSVQRDVPCLTERETTAGVTLGKKRKQRDDEEADEGDNGNEEKETATAKSAASVSEAGAAAAGKKEKKNKKKKKLKVAKEAAGEASGLFQTEDAREGDADAAASVEIILPKGIRESQAEEEEGEMERGAQATPEGEASQRGEEEPGEKERRRDKSDVMNEGGDEDEGAENEEKDKDDGATESQEGEVCGRGAKRNEQESQEEEVADRQIENGGEASVSSLPPLAEVEVSEQAAAEAQKQGNVQKGERRDEAAGDASRPSATSVSPRRSATGDSDPQDAAAVRKDICKHPETAEGAHKEEESDTQAGGASRSPLSRPPRVDAGDETLEADVGEPAEAPEAPSETGEESLAVQAAAEASGERRGAAPEEEREADEPRAVETADRGEAEAENRGSEAAATATDGNCAEEGKHEESRGETTKEDERQASRESGAVAGTQNEANDSQKGIEEEQVDAAGAGVTGASTPAVSPERRGERRSLGAEGNRRDALSPACETDEAKVSESAADAVSAQSHNALARDSVSASPVTLASPSARPSSSSRGGCSFAEPSVSSLPTPSSSASPRRSAGDGLPGLQDAGASSHEPTGASRPCAFPHPSHSLAASAAHAASSPAASARGSASAPAPTCISSSSARASSPAALPGLSAHAPAAAPQLPTAPVASCATAASAAASSRSSAPASAAGAVERRACERGVSVPSSGLKTVPCRRPLSPLKSASAGAGALPRTPLASRGLSPSSPPSASAGGSPILAPPRQSTSKEPVTAFGLARPFSQPSVSHPTSPAGSLQASPLGARVSPSPLRSPLRCPSSSPLPRPLSVAPSAGADGGSARPSRAGAPSPPQTKPPQMPQ
ncbi:hypothetical protein BESB_039020 [Besnoitia besnoiti]|uniref:Nucleolar complex-associated protein 3 N-terminal domain-containing protein n=1 Tax=Besnoitia besnoiti TaxID=94643 RepID=A0A2A9MJT5_BESBE|nr:hypothetical protein BESB_039020 [Besnoitia besnoiti]PFH37444.1 hypothetical protein BESB_039020 [Besnoitia besnoiti]